MSMMITATPYQSFSSKGLVKDGCCSQSCKRFEELSIRSPSLDLRGSNEGYVGKSTSFRLSRLYNFHSWKNQSRRLHPVSSSTSANEDHSHSSAESECCVLDSFLVFLCWFIHFLVHD